MATTCDSLIAADIQQNCTDPIQKGVERIGVIMNRSDVDFGSVVKDATYPKHVITTLPLKASKRGYKVIQPAKTPFNGTKTEMAEGAYMNSMGHELQFVILDSGPEVAEMVDALLNGSFVMVLENMHKQLDRTTKPGISTFQIYGYHQGLTASAIASEKWSDDTNSGWLVTMKESQVPVSALYMYNTSYEQSKAAFDSLSAVD